MSRPSEAPKRMEGGETGAIMSAKVNKLLWLTKLVIYSLRGSWSIIVDRIHLWKSIFRNSRITAPRSIPNVLMMSDSSVERFSRVVFKACSRL